MVWVEFEEVENETNSWLLNKATANQTLTTKKKLLIIYKYECVTSEMKINLERECIIEVFSNISKKCVGFKR